MRCFKSTKTKNINVQIKIDRQLPQKIKMLLLGTGDSKIDLRKASQVYL